MAWSPTVEFREGRQDQAGLDGRGCGRRDDLVNLGLSGDSPRAISCDVEEPGRSFLVMLTRSLT